MKRTLCFAFLLASCQANTKQANTKTDHTQISAYLEQRSTVSAAVHKAYAAYDSKQTAAELGVLFAELNQARAALPPSAPPELADCDKQTRETVQTLTDLSSPAAALAAELVAKIEKKEPLPPAFEGILAIREELEKNRGKICEAFHTYRKTTRACSSTATDQEFVAPLPFEETQWSPKPCPTIF